MSGSARIESVSALKPLAKLGRLAASFLVLPINLERQGIKKAAVLPEPV